MGASARTRAIIVWVIAGLLIGFAPVFHAICIASIAASASGEGMVHTMADGTVMSSASFLTDEWSTDPADSRHADAATVDPDWLSDVSAIAIGLATGVHPSIGDLGMILIVVGLGVPTMFAFIRWRVLARSFGHPPPIVALVGARPVVAGWPLLAVDLDVLGIARM